MLGRVGEDGESRADEEEGEERGIDGSGGEDALESCGRGRSVRLDSKEGSKGGMDRRLGGSVPTDCASDYACGEEDLTTGTVVVVCLFGSADAACLFSVVGGGKG